jgi:GT2 family glycosyltransferase
MLRADAVAELGGLDERFFLYGEETDWQRRAVDAGWTVACADVLASHVGAGTSTDETARETFFHAGHERYLRKHHGAAGWRSYRTAAALGALVRSVVLPGDRGREARRRYRIYRTGPLVVEARR